MGADDYRKNVGKIREHDKDDDFKISQLVLVPSAAGLGKALTPVMPQGAETRRPLQTVDAYLN